VVILSGVRGHGFGHRIDFPQKIIAEKLDALLDIEVFRPAFRHSQYYYYYYY